MAFAARSELLDQMLRDGQLRRAPALSPRAPRPLPTGIAALDAALGGGLARGQLPEGLGPPGAGGTALLRAGLAVGPACAQGGETRRRAAPARAGAAGGDVRGRHHRARARARAVGRPPGRAGTLSARRARSRRGLAAQADAAVAAAAVDAAAS